jgi:lipopolysaccharide transport system ATP-binding protein
MSDTVIRVENLGKKYIIGHQANGHRTLRDVLADAISFRSFRNQKSEIRNLKSEPFWALKDVSFEVKQGEVVGIIGRNGAGKSTLLKILSRITEPTEGRVRIRGRVASLLEVGTGFHPELTGRENVFLNGAILGMSRAEIKRKFDEIVAFAEVEKFLDTPVKRYSSGMYVRLAFAVAAHLEPEILIIDEVLAVGDAQFQKKCLGKMEQVGREGRTVLFVSHNMAAIETLCTSVIQLKAGEVVTQGDVRGQVEDYLSSIQQVSEVTFGKSVAIGPNLTLRRFEFLPNPIASGDNLDFKIEIVAKQADRIDSLVVLLHSPLGQRVAIIDLRSAACPFILGNAPLTMTGQINSLPLVEGQYHVGLYIDSAEVRGDFAYLSRVTVLARPGSSEVIPYPAIIRGFVELIVATQVVPKVMMSEMTGD